MTNPLNDPEYSADTSAAPAAPHTGSVHEYGSDQTQQIEEAAQKKGGAIVWTALIVGALILILLLVFIVQNNQTVGIDYFGWSFNLPLGVAMLLSAIAGVLIAGTIGTVRIVQLGSRLKKIRKVTSR